MNSNLFDHGTWSTVRSQVWWGRPRGRFHSFGGSSMPAYCPHQSQNGRRDWRLSIRLSGWQEAAQSRSRLPDWWHKQWMGLVECVEGTTHRMRRDSRRLLYLTVMSHISDPNSKTGRTYCTVVFSQRGAIDERGNAIYSWLRTSCNLWRSLSFSGSNLHFLRVHRFGNLRYVYVKDSSCSTKLSITFVLRMTH